MKKHRVKTLFCILIGGLFLKCGQPKKEAANELVDTSSKPAQLLINGKPVIDTLMGNLIANNMLDNRDFKLSPGHPVKPGRYRVYTWLGVKNDLEEWDILFEDGTGLFQSFYDEKPHEEIEYEWEYKLIGTLCLKNARKRYYYKEKNTFGEWNPLADEKYALGKFTDSSFVAKFNEISYTTYVYKGPAKRRKSK